MIQRRRRSAATASAFGDLGVDGLLKKDGHTRSFPRNGGRRDPPDLPSRRPRPSPRDGGQRDPPSLTPCRPRPSTTRNSGRRDSAGLPLRQSRRNSIGRPRESAPAAKRDNMSSPSKPPATYTAKNDTSDNPSVFRPSLPEFRAPKPREISGNMRAKSASATTAPRAVIKNSSEARPFPYRVGQVLRDPGHALPFASSSQASDLLAVLPMKTPLFVKRTSREWTYATLMGRVNHVGGEMSIVVRVDEITKSKKVLKQSEWQRFLRLVNKMDGLDQNKMDQRNDLAALVARGGGNSFASAANGGGNGDAFAALRKNLKPGPRWRGSRSGGNTYSESSHSDHTRTTNVTARADADSFDSAFGNHEFGHGRSDAFLPPPRSTSLTALPSRHQHISSETPRHPVLPLPRPTSLSALWSRHQLIAGGTPRHPVLPLPRSTSLLALRSRDQLIAGRSPQRPCRRDRWTVPLEISTMVKNSHKTSCCSSTSSSWSMTNSSDSISSSNSYSSDSSSGSSHSSFDSSSSISL